MRKKNYKGAKISKRVVAKCEGVCRTYDAIQLVRWHCHVQGMLLLWVIPSNFLMLLQMI